MAQVATSTDKLLTSTALTNVLVVHVNEPTNFEVYGYVRTTATARVQVFCTFADGAEARSVLLMDGDQPAGSYTFLPLTISAAPGTPVLITAESNVADVATISATVKRLAT